MNIIIATNTCGLSKEKYPKANKECEFLVEILDSNYKKQTFFLTEEQEKDFTNMTYGFLQRTQEA